MSQSSRTPYDHLRYRYPETWRKLVSILDKEGAPVAMSPSGLVRPGGGFRIEGAHAGPSEASPTSTALSRTASDPAFLKWKQQDEQSVHTLRMMKKERRNPFGSWYEGSKVVEKIGGVASNDPCGTRKKPRERSGLRGGKGWTVVLGCVVSLSYIRNKHFAGFAEVNATEERQLFYWFVEAANGNKPGVTPNVIWMNGGPGASSITGLLVENIGPLTMDQSDGLLKENPHAWSNDYNVMVIDNPVGSGFSYTGKKSYVTSEKEMREDFYTALKVFFKKHPEYMRNPLWVTGESYGG
ncbi:Lysosomal protective protein (Carboxypeptidase C) (Carboxypeptidase L) (Cathepsin A) (Protective protein cathepsin A) (PPCA) (Protective protein for beta-galactosidase) [Cleaved into: Lysosomal protective protein 32 kDa chain, partial [Durusdinium trenchii]